MFCYKCGKQLDEGTNFCPHCGATQKKDENNQQKEDAKKVKSSQKQMKANKKVIAIACVAVVILGAIIGIVASISAKKNEEAMIKAVIGTEWHGFHAGLGRYIDVIFEDEDTVLYDLGPGEGTDEYEWWVEKVDGNRLVIKDNPVAQDIYDEGGRQAQWYSLAIEYTIVFEKSGSVYMPYALINEDGNIIDSK